MLIGEVSARSGVSTRMLRHYDRIGLVCPTARTAGGYRRYSEDDVRRLFHVEGLRTLGLGLKEIADAFDDPSLAPARVVDRLLAQTAERIARDEELLRRLTRVRQSAPTAWSDVLRTIGLLRGLDTGSPSERQRTALTLSEDGAVDVGVLVEAALEETDPNVAGALHWAIARAGDAAVPSLAAALDAADPGRRRRALTALVKLGNPAASAAIAAATGHPDPTIANRATLERGAHGDAETIPALVSLIASGDDDIEAAEVLGLLVATHPEIEAAAVRALSAALDAGEPDARLRLAAALAEVPGPTARSLLDALTAHPDHALALTATSILRRRSPLTD
ncbi:MULTISPECIES: MerR family transcriptional regulator [Bacteria]|uniref:MerR family transcriptional regulator n=1 Tax=Bacteria TaxID=2 RepID=UPI003C7E6C5C